MATGNPCVWFKSISLENVRSFGTKQTINFTNKDGKAAQWNVILGDNGTGKTTVLKGLVLSYLKITDDAIKNSYRDSLIKNSDSLSSIWVECEIGTDATLKHRSVMTKNFNLLRQLLNEEDKDLDSEYRPINSLLVHGYGAARRIGDSAITEEMTSQVESIFDESVDLINAEEWLVQADYLAYKNKNLRGRYVLVVQILKKLFQEEVLDIFIDTETGTPKVYFNTYYGAVRLHELSLGYKTLIAWMVDFAKGLLDRYPDSPDPLAEPAVCLVDEIDLHLHPKFQRNIIQFLTETFPNTQFIVTAHSPLIVVAAEERPLDANIILLKREGDETVVVNDPIDVGNWSVDQILNSDLFGHTPARSESLTELRMERDKLLAKPKLTKKDNARLAELDEQIGFIPFGQDQAEVQAETIIQRLADVLRRQQQVQ